MPAEQAAAPTGAEHATAELITQWRERSEQGLAEALAPQPNSCERLQQAMRYAVLGGGKRLRPLLVYAAGYACAAPLAHVDAAAAAVELIHAYSLAHDDLPAMDDDALRRGRPTVHIAFDEATAILAGDALQTLAFDLLANAPAAPLVRLDWIRQLSHCAGLAGMCGGQSLDMVATGGQQVISVEQLAHLHALKTGALIRASVNMGARAGTDNPSTLTRLDGFAQALGLAFQIRDDILDVEGSSAQLGKTAGKDQAQAKATYPALLGMEGAKAELLRLNTAMRDALSELGTRVGPLSQLAALAIHRSH